MAIIKCKMCGGDLVVVPDSTVAECEFCGTRQTVPSADNEKKMTLFNRANRLRFGCEFDKAAGIYEAIVADFPEEAEAYWGLVLCKYGIEYVDDPATAKKIPTCHRSSFDCVMDDGNFEQALENADATARKVYRAEAKQIEEIRKGIIEVSSKEDPYDIFICYKETDENGDRTLDSVLAQDIYDALTEKGYRTFFARITLEDKLGQEYEPYIFAALNSAKIMLAVGTDYEYFNAVWVKNEWSRFLYLIASGQKKTLIPCYKNIDAYDMPKEFAKLQAQDLGKVGAMQDLLRGVEKILSKPNHSQTTAQVAAHEAVRSVEQEKIRNQVENSVSLGIMALDSENTDKAIQHFEDALRLDSECIGAYLGLLRIIRDGVKSAPYKDKLNAISTSKILDYIKNHRSIIGNLEKDNNLLTISIKSIQSEELIKGLLDMGIRGNAVNALIQYVNRFDDVCVVQSMIASGADINASIWWTYDYQIADDFESYKNEEHSVLSTAIQAGRNTQIIETLIKAGADVNYIVRQFSYCQTFGKKPDGRLSLSFSILNRAVRSGRYDVAELLLKSGADPNSTRINHTTLVFTYDSDRGIKASSPFTEDVVYSNVSETIWNTKDTKMLELLLSHKADPNQVMNRPVYRYSNGYCRNVLLGRCERTNLIDAVLYSDDPENVRILLTYGADPKSVYRYSEGPNEHGAKTTIPVLGLAVQRRLKDIISQLIEAGASFSEEAVYDVEGPYRASQNKHDRIVDRFPLSEYAFQDDIVDELGSLIKMHGWKGSKSGWFKKAHACYYRW